MKHELELNLNSFFLTSNKVFNFIHDRTQYKPLNILNQESLKDTQRSKVGNLRNKTILS